MKLIVKINYGKVTQEITLPVGKGTQTVKWLSFAAAFRFVQDGARRGYQHGRYTLPLKTQLLPKYVRTDEIPFLHPDDVIASCLSDGDAVIVDLYDTLPMDEFGIPTYSPWANIAFFHENQEVRARLIEEEMLKVETFRREKEEEALAAKSSIERPKIELMKRILATQLVDDATIATTFNAEWSQVKSILDNVVPDETHQEEIRHFFLKYFVELNDLYKFYSAVNSGGGTHTLEYMELCKFVTETGVLGEEHSNAVLRIFLDSHIKRGRVKPSIHSEIGRPEFLLVLIKIAILKNITLKRKENSRLRKQGKIVSITKGLPTPIEALEMIYTDFLAPVLERMPAGAKMRESISSPEVMLTLHDHLEQLAKCFSSYADGIDDEGADGGSSEESGELSIVPHEGSMTVEGFMRFAMDLNFLDDGDESAQRVSNHGKRHSIVGDRAGHHTVSQKDIRQIFSASQHDSDEAEAVTNKIAEDDGIEHHHQLMEFAEFLEAVARLGVLKHAIIVNNNNDSSGEKESAPEVPSYHQCIKMAVERVASKS